MMLFRDRSCRGVLVQGDGNGAVFIPTAGYCAIGAGKDIALGALYAGSSPGTAVAAAVEMCAHCGGRVIVEEP